MWLLFKSKCKDKQTIKWVNNETFWVKNKLGKLNINKVYQFNLSLRSQNPTKA